MRDVYKRQEAHACGKVAGAAIAADPDDITIGDVRHQCFGREKPHFDVAGRQQSQHRPTGRHHFARAEIDLLDGAVDGTKDATASEPGLGLSLIHI